MDRQKISELIDATFAGFNAHDADKFVAQFTDDMRYDDTSEGESYTGRARFREYLGMWIFGFSDGKITVKNKIIDVEGNHAVAQLRFEGTHDSGQVLGVPPTGKKVDFEFVAVVQVGEEKFQSLTAYYNVGMVLRQIGKLPQELPA